METRAIKSLSATEIGDLRAGRGAGFALAAELNGYPGPRHVLDLADRLHLSPPQRAQTEALFAEMQAGAIELGEKLISAEADIEAAFLGGTVALESLRESVAAAGRLRTELRAHHLAYHVAQKALLTPHQVALYRNLRGYDGGAGSKTDHTRSH
jgi:hypothetical protein